MNKAHKGFGVVFFLFIGSLQVLEGAESKVKEAITTLRCLSDLNNEDNLTKLLNAAHTLKNELSTSESDTESDASESVLGFFIKEMRNKVGAESRPNSVLLTDTNGIGIFDSLMDFLIDSGPYKLDPDWDALHLCNALPNQVSNDISQKCEKTVSRFVSSLIRKNPSGNHEWELALPFIENKTIKSSVQMALQGSTQSQRRTHPQRNLHPHPYQCDQCGKCFGRSCNLIRHKNACNKVKPYVCRHCSKRFADRDRLETHQASHSSSSSSSSSARSTKSS